jgi:hypothetical protein
MDLTVYRTCCMASTGPDVPTNEAIHIYNPSNSSGCQGYVHTSNTTDYARTANGTGFSAAETYMVYNPANPSSTMPIQAGDTAAFMSVQTGKYCRLAPLPSNASLTGMVCDVSSLGSASIITYTGRGLAFNNTPLVPTGPVCTLVLDANANVTEEILVRDAPPAPPPPPGACDEERHTHAYNHCAAVAVACLLPSGRDAAAARTGGLQLHSNHIVMCSDTVTGLRMSLLHACIAPHMHACL